MVSPEVDAQRVGDRAPIHSQLRGAREIGRTTVPRRTRLADEVTNDAGLLPQFPANDIGPGTNSCPIPTSAPARDLVSPRADPRTRSRTSPPQLSRDDPVG